MKIVKFLQQLRGETVTVELKNGTSVHGTVTSVDYYMNITISNAKVRQTDGETITMDKTRVTGSNIRDVILPDTLNLESLLKK
ncbi:Like-Sm (LSM) domain containing protein, LSm4/SmD1/SmD3 like protein [Aduncisulcus paluster]|uniref:Like-Sm (LSM) domain containing protein, LSm4/SmD1/SmD3 like protein n=1 Tax=Aduncisulcus paluster TaxID=2918883 RepID=A0ABQ5K822_9EUKA|nr:Like-Sm (LSM) domain containing protein, LSm4/SmD1/SmD3 like protein [Aduncisulcus paluster]